MSKRKKLRTSRDSTDLDNVTDLLKTKIAIHFCQKFDITESMQDA